MMLGMAEQDLVLNRWRRFGKDRLYVESSEGLKVGFWDLLTDTGHPASPEDEPALTAAITSWKSQMSQPEATAPAQGTQPDDPGRAPGPERQPLVPVPTLSVHDTVPEEMVRPWVDLATNKPGKEARERAQSARDAAPVRTVLARVLGVHTDERAWRIGADGEEKVAAQLAKVAKKNPRWRFLHAIPVGDRGSDIDHLIIGPGGVFTVNAKHHPGAKIWVGGNTLMVNGIRQPYVRNSRHEAQRAAKLLTATCGFPVLVEGLIVTVNAREFEVKSQPQGLHVTWRNNLAKWLLRHGDIHSDQTIEAIYEAARRSTTWSA